MKNLKTIIKEVVMDFDLNEDPDTLKRDGYNLHYNDIGAYPFLMYEDRVYVSLDDGKKHSSIISDYTEFSDMDAYDKDIKYQGRIWTDEKLISFWKYPPPQQLKTFITNLEEAFKRQYNMNIDIWNDPDYRIDMTSDMFARSDYENMTPVKFFGGSEDWSEEELQNHIDSPMSQSKQNRTIPQGVGSKKYGQQKPLAYRQATQMDENMNEAIDVFHGSDRQFDKFDMSKVGTGDGKSLGGWGIYFSDNEDVSQRYYTQGGFVRPHVLRSGNYFDLDQPLEDGQRILNALQRQGVGENDLEEFQSDFIDNYDVTGKQAYDWMAYVLGGEKEASELLDSIGYLGNTMMDKWETDSRNYIVFDTSAIIR